MDGVAGIVAQVRDAVRRDGVDAVREPAAVRALVEAAVAAFERQVADGVLAPAGERAGLIRQVLDHVAGFGALQPYLDDPTVEEIWINEPGKVFVARHGQSELTTTQLRENEVHMLVERMLAHSGRRVDLSTPFVDAVLPDGSRLHVAIPEVTARHWAVNIRKHIVRAARLTDLVGLGTITAPAAAFLAGAVEAGLNVLVSGGTQAGKTTLLNCLAAAVPARERVITCEEVFELRVPRRDVVAMQCRPASLEGAGEIALRRLVIEALRMRPDRLIVGEVRQAEALDLLIALNSGIPGMCSVHANSAREAVTKMCTLPLLAGENVSSRFVVPTVAAALDLVVHLDLHPGGRRRVREVLALTGEVHPDDPRPVATVPLFVTRAGELVRGEGRLPADRHTRSGLDPAALLP